MIVELLSKLYIALCIIVIVLGAVIWTYANDITTAQNTTSIDLYVAGEDHGQTPYVLVVPPHIDNNTARTPLPTPTPLYYERLEYPDEPCSETLEIYNANCMGRIKNDSYCDYWRAQSCKNCEFIQC